MPEILYADAAVAVVVKPAGVLSQGDAEDAMPALLQKRPHTGAGNRDNGAAQLPQAAFQIALLHQYTSIRQESRSARNASRSAMTASGSNPYFFARSAAR